MPHERLRTKNSGTLEISKNSAVFPSFLKMRHAGIEPDYSIPDDSEWKLIENYRSLDSAGKNTVDAVIEQEIERSKEVIELLKHIEELELKLHEKDEEQKEESKIVPMVVQEDTDYLAVKAAHAIEGASEEEKSRDEEKMKKFFKSDS